MYIYVIDCDSILKIGLHTSTYDTEKTWNWKHIYSAKWPLLPWIRKTSSTPNPQPIPGPNCLDFKFFISFSASIHQAFLDARFHVVFFKGNVGIGPKVGPRLNFIGKHKNVWVFENISRLLTAEHLQRTWENPYGTIPTQTHMRASQETQKKADRWIPPKNILMANKHLLSKNT